MACKAPQQRGGPQGAGGYMYSTSPLCDCLLCGLFLQLWQVAVDAQSSAKPMPRGGAELEYPGEFPGQNAMPRGGAELEYPGEYPGQYSNEVRKERLCACMMHSQPRTSSKK